MVSTNPILTVIIPTIGRETLTVAINSIVEDVHPVVRIVVVAHGQKSFEKIRQLQLDEKLVDIEVYPSTGTLSDLCNYGLSLANTPYIAFFSDDDVWLPKKGKVLLDLLEKNKSINVAVGRSRTVKRIASVRPKNLLSPKQSVFGYLFGRKTLLSNPVQIHLQSAVIRNSNLPEFRSKINVYEDITWLQDLHTKGGVLSMVPDIVTEVRPSLNRSNKRQTLEVIEWMYEEVNQYDQKLSRNFLRYHAPRSAEASGDFSNFIMIMRLRFKRIGIEFLDFLVVPVQLIITLFFWCLKLLRTFCPIQNIL